MAEVISYEKLQPFVRLPHPVLSEGISIFNNKLFWVDIFKGEIYFLNKDLDDVSKDQLTEEEKKLITTYKINKYTYDGKYPFESYNHKEIVGVVFPYDKEYKYILFGSKYGIGKLDLNTGKWYYLITFDQCESLSKERFLRLRSNDGGISRDGHHLYIGLMDTFDEDLKDEGCILEYTFATNKLRLLFDGYNIKIPNSIHYDSEDKNILYITDSLNFKVWKYNKSTNEREELICIKKVNTEFESPEPDGSFIDYENNLFITAVWSTSKIQIFDLKKGTLQKELILPTTRISCCCKFKNDLFVTTANMNIDDNETHEIEDNVGGSIYKIQNVFNSINHPKTIHTKKYPVL